MSESIRVPIKIHPRAFSAFGEDLITNENIAMIELVKNSYDAYALKVEIEFGYDQLGAPFISITDDGCGMTRDTIENAWATIATFYKKARPYISRTFKVVDAAGRIQTVERTRTVSGNKGLGRFSAARLGHEILEHIVAKEFRPVIVFSAHDLSNVLEDILITHRLIDFTRKGDDDSNLAEKIDTWKDSALALSRMRHSMNEALIESAKVLDVFQKMAVFPSPEIVSFMLSRRTIQYFEQAEVGEQPPTWIQYVYPPMMNNLLVADVLRIHSEDTDQSQPGIPSEYRVVLTPSCDMVNHAADDFKVLVGYCCDKERFTEQRLGNGQDIDSNKGREKVDRVVKELQYGYNKAFVALPELPHVLPYMTLNLKDLDFVMLAEIAPTLESFDKAKHRYYRVASVASPFREQVIWAHMINSCRPGMPVRDTIDWAKGILTS